MVVSCSFVSCLRVRKKRENEERKWSSHSSNQEHEYELKELLTVDKQNFKADVELYSADSLEQTDN